MSNISETDNESSLRYWLAQEDWYMSRYTRKWLERTPPDRAANVLTLLAERAQPEPHSLLHRMLGGVAASFATSENIAGGVPVRRVGTRAALMLATMGDVRCIPPLLRVFETNPSWSGKYQELVEAALINVFKEIIINNTLESTLQSEMQDYTGDMWILVGRVWNSGASTRDLSNSLTELLLVTLQCLQMVNCVPNLAILHTITAASVTKPNRLRIQYAAQNMINI